MDNIFGRKGLEFDFLTVMEYYEPMIRHEVIEELDRQPKGFSASHEALSIQKDHPGLKVLMEAMCNGRGHDILPSFEVAKYGGGAFLTYFILRSSAEIEDHKLPRILNKHVVQYQKYQVNLVDRNTNTLDLLEKLKEQVRKLEPGLYDFLEKSDLVDQSPSMWFGVTDVVLSAEIAAGRKIP